MPPLASRLIRTSRAVRSQRFSSTARDRLAVREHERRRAGVMRQAEPAAQLDAPAGVRDVVRQVPDGGVRDLLGGSPVSSSISHSRDWRATSALRSEQLAQRVQIVVVGLARERAR